MFTGKIFSMDSAKAIKAQGYGYLNAIMYMAPATLAGTGNVCPHASPACLAACLGWTSGQASLVKRDDDINPARASRIAKTKSFMQDRQAFMLYVVKSIKGAERKAQKANLKLCVRLNGSSDIAWEGVRFELEGKRVSIFEAFPHVQFVDYTKNPYRFNRALPSNYHLTFSRSETNEAQALELLAKGVNVAVVFGGGLPTEWNEFQVVNGDEHDLRHLDPKGGFVIGLSPKGRKAQKETSGFVVRDYKAAAA